MQLCIFEDSNCLNFEPIVYSRPVYDLICGINTLRQKILRSYPKVKYTLHCRPYIAPVVKLHNPGVVVNSFEDTAYLFINGSVIAPVGMKKIIPLKHEEDVVYMNGNRVIAAYVSGNNLQKLKSKLNKPIDNLFFSGLPVKQVKINYASYLWDLINLNGEEIKNDFCYLQQNLKDKKIIGKVHTGAYILGKKNIIIEKDAVIKPGAVIDATQGPVYIGKNSVVYPNAVIEGPVFIGKNSQIKSGANIHNNVSICDTCRIGGEVEDSIFLAYSNKQHDGFIGHAYIGSWVNLGAGTNCSNLKNNYGNVRAYVNGSLVNSGSQFLGLIMGDHSKSAINTMFNTGTNAGFFSNIFGAGFPDIFIPSFSWGGSQQMTTYEAGKAIDVAKIVMARRNKQMHTIEENLIKTIFELTKAERRKRGYPD